MSQGMHLGYPKQLTIIPIEDKDTKITSICYDNAKYLWVFTFNEVTHKSKVHVVEWFAIYNTEGAILEEKDWVPNIKYSFNLPDTFNMKSAIVSYDGITMICAVDNVRFYKEDYTLKTRYGWVNPTTNEMYRDLDNDTMPDFEEYEEGQYINNGSFNKVFFFSIKNLLSGVLSPSALTIETTSNTRTSPVRMRSNIIAGPTGGILMVSDALFDNNGDKHKIYKLQSGVFTVLATLDTKKQREKVNIWTNPHHDKVIISNYNDFSFTVFDLVTSAKTVVPCNGYPTIGTHYKDNEYVFCSFRKMLSKYNIVTGVVLDIASVEENTTSIFSEPHTDFIWSNSKSDNKTIRLNMIDKTFILPGSGKDYNILGIFTNGPNGLTNLAFNDKSPYTKVELGTSLLVVTPKFDITYYDSSEIVKTIWPRVFFVNDTTVTVANANDIEFVYEKPITEETDDISFVKIKGNSMVGSGDTHYIGEFFE